MRKGIDRKGVDITIIQAPVSVEFTCPHCEEEIDIDFVEFGHSLSSLLYDSVDFKCPSCEKELSVNSAELD